MDKAEAFQLKKKEIADAILIVRDSALPSEIEMDASDDTIAASLVQNGSSLAFFSITSTTAK